MCDKVGPAGIHGCSSYYFFLSVLLGSLTISVITSSGSQTHAASPITSSGLNTQVSTPIVTGSGATQTTQYNISGGTRPGGAAGTNLFHSFGNFNVSTNNIANFLNAGSIDLAGNPLAAGLPTSNILGRINGGNPSSIFGMIQTNGPGGFPNANLFLMNPNGFLFGPTATINVGGMVTFTTADYMRLTDNARFNAVAGPADVLLTAAPVAAFGFLGNNPAAIAIQGSTLQVAQGQSLSLVGGNQGFIATNPDTGNPINVPGGVTMTGGKLLAQGGQINLASVAGPGEISAVDFMPTAGMAMGNINLSQGALLDVSADAAGTVRIRGGQLVMDNATISADTVNSNGSPVAIDINVTGDISLTTVENPVLTARTTGSGNAGAIHIASTNMDLTGSAAPNNFSVSVIDTHTSGSGKAGDVSITAANNLTMTGAGDPSNLVFAIDSGTTGASVDGAQGGNVTLTAKNISLQSVLVNTGTGVDTQVNFLDGAGSGGNLTLTADSLQGFLTQMITDGVGNAGNITISARNVQFTTSPGLSAASVGGNAGSIRITADQIKLDDFVTFGSTNQAGSGGDISVNAKVVELTNGSSFATQTLGNGNAGNITITATDHVTFADDPSIQGAPVNPSGLFTNSFGNFGRFGNSGAISVTTPRLTINGGARIESSTRSSGHGGAVNITADTISIEGERPFEPFSGFFVALGSARASGIFTRTVGSRFCTGPCGDAGNVFITTGTLNLASGAQINSGTTSTGRGGDIVVNATGAIGLSGTTSDGRPSGILSQAAGTAPGAGAGGDITLTAGQSVSISNGAAISASSTGPGSTGNITINAGTQFAMTKSSVTTEADQSSGGAIKITTNPNGTVQLTDSKISASVLDGTGGGGSVTIDPQFVLLQNSQILAKAESGPGGNINITTNLLLQDATSKIDASSQFGQNGTITIQSPIAPASRIVLLSQKPLVATSLITARCAALAQGNFSSFTVAGRDSLPAEPSSWLSSPLALAASEFGGGPVSEASTRTSPSESVDEMPVLSLRRIAPPGFLTQGFALESSPGCTS